VTTTRPGPELRVGRYQLLTVIGEGGMGVVHLARDESGRRVALKVLRPHIVGDQEARQRLAQEVASLGRVRSPRVAEIVDADPWGEVPYVATRYVAGPTLHELVRTQGPIPAEDLLWFAEGLADALLAVHRVGVLHRDIKPSNVLVEGRSPVLIDFGLARLAEDPRLTATGWLLGTPGYLAPEILYGDEPTPASDVHAWAATLVHAATGRAPYGKGPAMAIMDRVRRGEHDLSAVPDEVRPLLTSCLDPDPLARPPLVELHRDLLRRLGQPVPAPASVPVVDDVETTRRVPLLEAAPPLPEPLPVPTPILTPRRAEGLPPATQVLSTERPLPAGVLPPSPAHARRRTRALLGLGVFGTALVAFAPYLGATILVVLALVARMASVTLQRHTRRRDLRGGHPKWYDVPASTIASPGYLAISLAGSAVLVLWAVATAIATGAVVYLARVPLTPGLLVVGAVFVGSLWWGPASQRVREMTRRWSRPLADDGRRSWIALGIGVFGALMLVSLLAAGGPRWSPKPSAPWAHGFLHQLAKVL
jgi:predicted Ser/Thr protein kinase